MCSTLMFGTLKLGLIDLQSAPQNFLCVLTNFAEINFRENRLNIFISAKIIIRIIFGKTANFFNFLAHLLLSYTYFRENFREKKSFRENLAPSKFVHKNVFFVSHVADKSCHFFKKRIWKSIFVDFRTKLRNFRIFSRFSRKCENKNVVSTML